MNLKYLLTAVLFVFCFQNIVLAQEKSSDELFIEARKAAFDQKNYSKAIAISKLALIKSPNYADIQVFLGRLYTWSDQNDSARTVFMDVLTKSPDHEDATLAYGSLEYWNDNSLKSLDIVNAGLAYHPQSKNLLLLKAKLLNNLKRWQEADVLVEILLKLDPKNTNARSLAGRIRDNSARNKIGISYDLSYFDQQFDDPWHLVSLDYSRQTGLGSVVGKINYGNRFKSNGIQFDLDAYPSLSKIFYAYVSGGYSNFSIFPKYRAGFSLYANLPLSFEADVGFRYLNFGSNTWIYTGSIGKYYKSYWFNLRTYITPSNSRVSTSYSFTGRYYFGGADDYLSLKLGTGLSPDESSNNLLIGTSSYKLTSNNVSLSLRKTLNAFNLINVSIGLENQEYRLNTRGNQFDLGLAYTIRF